MNESEDDDNAFLVLLVNQLQNNTTSNHGRDECYWVADEDTCFSVKACGAEFRRKDNVVGMQPGILRSICFIWELKVPSKVGIFCLEIYFG